MAKIKLLRFTPDLIVQQCKSGDVRVIEVIKNRLPEDATCVGVNVEINPQCFVLTIHSDMFPNVAEGESIPELPSVGFANVPLALLPKVWSSPVRENKGDTDDPGDQTR